MAMPSFGDAVINTDTSGFVTSMNPVAEALTGWRQEDAVGIPLKDVFNIIIKETGEPDEDPATKVLREGVVVELGKHTLLIARDGTRRPVDYRGAPIRDRDGKIIGMVLVFRDITETRRMEQKLIKADLPASLKEAPAEEGPAEAIRAGMGRILVMDDDALVRRAVGNMLKALRYEAEFAADGAEAIELYGKAMVSGKPFDAVILDLTVHVGLGGKETVQRLAEIDPGVKAIVSSGYSSDPAMANFGEHGFRDVVAKPYDVKDLGEALSRVLSGRDSVD